MGTKVSLGTTDGSQPFASVDIVLMRSAATFCESVGRIAVIVKFCRLETDSKSISKETIVRINMLIATRKWHFDDVYPTS